MVLMIYVNVRLSLIMAKIRRRKSADEKKMSVFNKIILTLNIIAALLLLLSYMAPSTDPRDNSIVAVLGFGYLALLFVNIIFVVYWAVVLKGYYTLISAICILLGIGMLLDNFALHFNNRIPKEKFEPNIRLMQYNVHEFEDRSKTHPIQNDITSLVELYQPDIISFEEYKSKALENGAIAGAIKKALKTNYFYFEPFSINNKDTTGNAIFSKYPIINKGRIPSPKMLGTRSLFADIKYGDKIIRVYSIHLAAVHIQENQKRELLKGNGYLDNTSFLKNMLSSAFVARSFQVSLIKKHISNCPYPVIIMGDFNDTPNSFAVNEIGIGLKNAFNEKGSGFETTYYSKLPLHIDYIFTSPQFDIINYEAFDNELSDHKPLISDIKRGKLIH